MSWKEWGVRFEGLMARGVGTDQEQKWIQDPWWKKAAVRLCGWLKYERRGRALLFIHEARRIVGCSSSIPSSGVRATVGTDEVKADTDVVIIGWSWERGQGGCIRGMNDRWGRGWNWNWQGSWLGRCWSWRLNWWGCCWWETDMAASACRDNWCTAGGDALVTMAVEEAAISQSVVIHSMDGALILFHVEVKSNFPEWTRRLEGSPCCWGRSRVYQFLCYIFIMDLLARYANAAGLMGSE